MGSKAFTILIMAVVFANVGWAQTLSTNVADVHEGDQRRRLTGEWNFEVGGGSFGEGKDEGALSYFTLRGKFNYSFTKWMRAKVAPGLDIYATRVQQRYDDDDVVGSRIRLSDAYLGVEPSEWFEIRGGAIGQHYLASNMLVSKRKTFPGLWEAVKGDWQNLHIEAVGEQVVPTSTSLNSERVEKEPLPSFQTESLIVKGHHQDWFEGSLVAGHFRWRDLPSKVAFESQLAGNLPEGSEVAAGARFRYGFNGYFWSSEMAVGPKEWAQMVVEYGGINNTSAPSNAGRAELMGIGPRLDFSNWQFDLRYRRYFVESDATVGLYNNARLGNNNRLGDHVEMTLDFKKLGFAVVGDWYNARTINDNPNQFTMNAIYVGVETHYAKF